MLDTENCKKSICLSFKQNQTIPYRTACFFNLYASRIKYLLFKRRCVLFCTNEKTCMYLLAHIQIKNCSLFQKTVILLSVPAVPRKFALWVLRLKKGKCTYYRQKMYFSDMHTDWLICLLKGVNISNLSILLLQKMLNVAF